MFNFTDINPSIEAYWRAIILFGKNSASYKFALAKSLLGLINDGKDYVTLNELADPFSMNVAEHLKICSKQITSPSSKFINGCKCFWYTKINADRPLKNQA